MSTKTVIALVILIVAVGAGVTFVTVVLPARQPASTPKPPDAGPALVIEENREPVTAESGVENHRDWRFQNPSDRPVTVRLDLTDCNCAHVLACVVPEAWNSLDAQELVSRSADPALAWQALEQGGAGLTVPPRAVGLVRLKWKATAQGPQRFWAGLWVEGDAGRGNQRVEVLVEFVEPVRIRAAEQPKSAEVDVGRLDAGDQRTAWFLCYSTTRESFTLTPTPPSDDPLVRCSVPQPLTREELRSLSDSAGNPVRAGYRLSVTVRERAGDTRLDLGPFHRLVAWRTDVFPGHEVSTHVNGIVLGEVSLAEPKGQTSVDLGTISPRDPRPVIFTLESRDPKLQLSVDEDKTLDFLQAELLEGKEGTTTGSSKTWRVRVQYRADAAFRGKFPNPANPSYDSAVVCSIVFLVARPEATGKPALRLFVPVHGTIAPIF
jgi:hypothetical protein